jgi:hypothetical protein
LKDAADRIERVQGLLDRAQPQQERVTLRAAQAAAVMPLIGPLLDAFEYISKDAKRILLEDDPDLCRSLDRINQAMEQAEAQPQQEAPAYKDCAPHLSVGDSAFESWFANKDMAGLGTKQLARDAYAAGMGDPLVAQPQQRGELPIADDARELSKWLNEEVAAPINRQALARVLASVQQPQQRGELPTREDFERVIGGPPYERSIARWPDDHTKAAWPGNYKDVIVDLAWCVFQDLAASQKGGEA